MSRRACYRLTRLVLYAVTDGAPEMSSAGRRSCVQGGDHMPITPGPQSVDLAGLQAQVEELADATAEAQRDATNAQDMVRRRDPRLVALEEDTVTLKQVAGTVASLSEESTADRQGLHEDLRLMQDSVNAMLQRLDNLVLQPGPPGKDGAPGSTGASAYELARQLGYGGTLTQWLTTLRGADGGPGAPGTPADMTRVAALEAKAPAFGYQATTALALAAAKDYVVTLNRAMPSATYNAKPIVDPALAGKLGAVVLSQTTTTVTVRTTALLAVGVGGFTVLAWP